MTKTDDSIFCHVGHEHLHQRGVGFLVAPRMKSVLKDRLIAIRLETKPRPITIIQVYMPMTDGDGEEVLEM